MLGNLLVQKKQNFGGSILTWFTLKIEICDLSLCWFVHFPILSIEMLFSIYSLTGLTVSKNKIKE